jgi:hypothetical protein
MGVLVGVSFGFGVQVSVGGAAVGGSAVSVGAIVAVGGASVGASVAV